MGNCFIGAKVSKGGTMNCEVCRRMICICGRKRETKGIEDQPPTLQRRIRRIPVAWQHGFDDDRQFPERVKEQVLR